MPSIEQLEAFVTAAEEGSFSAAGRKLEKVQSAVSTLVMNLEVDLDVVLFDRSRRSPELTGEGVALLNHARAVLRSSQELTACATMLSEQVEPRLTLAIEQGIFKAALNDVFADFSERYPFVDMNILDPGSGDVSGLLSAGDAEIGVMIEEEAYPVGFRFRGIGHSRLIPVCGPAHPLAQPEQTSHAQLRQHRQFIDRRSPATNAQQLRERKSPNAWYCESPYLVLDFLMSGFGWAELPEAVVGEKLERGELHRINYEFQQSEAIQGVDVVWSEKKALGHAGQWLLGRLLAVGPQIWPLMAD